MAKKDELRDLLDRLKMEVGVSRQEVSFQEVSGSPALEPETVRRIPAPEKALRPAYSKKPGEDPRHVQAQNVIWSENKEAMLFGVLAALVAVFGGILADLSYLTLIGAVVFMLFSFLMALNLFGFFMNIKRSSPGDELLSERLEALSRKVDTLSSRALLSSQSGQPAPGVSREMENKVEELRVLVKSLAKAVAQQNMP